MDLIQFPVLSQKEMVKYVSWEEKYGEKVNESENFTVQTADCIVFHPY